MCGAVGLPDKGLERDIALSGDAVYQSTEREIAGDLSGIVDLRYFARISVASEIEHLAGVILRRENAQRTTCADGERCEPLPPTQKEVEFTVLRTKHGSSEKYA